MSNLRVFNTPKFDFYVDRGSGQPSNLATFFITSEGVPISSDVSLGVSGPLEYSLDNDSWDIVSFSTGDTVELTQVYVRAVAGLNESVASGNINVGGNLIPYSITVDATPSLKVDAEFSNLKVLNQTSTTGTEYAISNIYVVAKNIDLVTTSQNPLVISVPTGFQVAFPLSGPGTQTWSQQVQWYGGVPSGFIYLQVRANRNKPPNSHEICKLSYTLPGLSPIEFASINFGYQGSKAYVRGQVASLSGICGQRCKPSTFVLDLIPSTASLFVTLTASSGFTIALRRIPPLASGVTSVFSGLRPNHYVRMINSTASSWYVDVYLSSNTISTNRTGTITIQCTTVSGGFESIVVPIPASTNAKAEAIPVCKWFNMVTPAEAGSVLQSVGLYRQDSSQIAPFQLSQTEFTIKYAGSAYYLDPEKATSPNSNVVSDPISYQNLLDTPPTTPGQWEIIVSWASFTEQSGITYQSGEVKLPYTILPDTVGSEVFYGVHDYIQYTVQNRYIHGLAYNPNPTAKYIGTVGGESLSSEGLNLFYSGVTRNGDTYSSFSPPNYPGLYTQNYYYSNLDVVFQSNQGVFGGGSAPHGLQNGDVLSLLESPTNANLLFSSAINTHVVEVIDTTKFKLKNGDEYFRCPVMGPYAFRDPRNQRVDCYPVYQTSTVKNPEVGNVVEYNRPFEIEQRALKINPQSPDRLFTTIDPGPRQVSIDVLPGDDLKFTMTENIYEFEDQETGELSTNANDWNGRKYIARSIYSTTGDSSVINKYNSLLGETYEGAQIFRKAYYVSWLPNQVIKTYDKSDWQDLDKEDYSITILGGENPEDYGLNYEVSLTAFPRKGSTGNDEPSVDVGNYIGYYEISTSGQNLDNLVLYPSKSLLQEINISQKLLNTPELIFSKKYDGTTKIPVARSDSILYGVISGDDVYINYVEALAPDAALLPVAYAMLAGVHSKNYSISSQEVYSNIVRRNLSVNLSARKTYNGRNNATIPLTVTYSGTVDPLQTEPVCFSITSPAYNSGDAGSAKTSSDVLQFLGLNPENYTFNFNYNNTSSTFQGSGTFVYGVNPVFGTIDPVVLLIDPQSLAGSKEYNGSVDASDSVSFNFLNVQGDDELDETDIRFTATLNNANRGLRSFSLVVTGMSPDSTYSGNYIISGKFSGACTVTPKPVTAALARTWLLFSGKTAASGPITHTYNKVNPSIVFNIPENPKNTTLYETSVVRLVNESEFAAVPEYSNAGQYRIRLSFTGWSNQNSFSNYKPDPEENAEYVEIPFSVLKAKIIVHTVSVTDTTYLAFGWNAPQIAFDTSGVLPGDSHNVTATGTYIANNGVYVPQSRVNLLFSTTNNNYEIDTVNSTSFVSGKVSPAKVSVSSPLSLNSNEKVYDGSRRANLTFSGITAGQPPALAGVATADQAFVSISAQSLTETFYASSNTGIRDISCFYQLTGARSANYSLGVTVFSGTILPKTISFQGMYGVSKVFDGNKVSSLSTDNFSYTGLVAHDVEKYAGTPVGNLSAYYTDFSAGPDKEVRLVGLQPPTPNYVLQDSDQGWFVLPEYNSTPYEIFRRPFILKAKGVSKYFGEILVTPLVNLNETEFEVRGLVEENFSNPIDPATGKHFGDKLLSATRVINEGAAREDSTGIYVGVVYASNPILERGDLNNYDLATGASQSIHSSNLVIIDASFQELTLPIKEAIWAKECSPFGCREESWFDLITRPNKKIAIVDFTNALPLFDTGDHVKIEQSVAEAEVLVTE